MTLLEQSVVLLKHALLEQINGLQRDLGQRISGRIVKTAEEFSVPAATSTRIDGRLSQIEAKKPVLAEMQPELPAYLQLFADLDTPMAQLKNFKEI